MVTAPNENTELNNHREPEADADNHQAKTHPQSNPAPQKKFGALAGSNPRLTTI